MSDKYKRPTRSWFARMGGKNQMAAKIAKMIPPHKTYVEPFVGAGWVFFAKEPSQVEVLNDLDTEMYYMFKDMKAVGDKFNKGKAMQNFKYDKKNFDRLRKLYKVGQFSKNATQRLIENLFLSKGSFAGMRTSFHSGVIGSRPNSSLRITRVDGARYKERLKNVKIYNKDYAKIIKQYNKPDTFFYLDPPYYKTTGYKEGKDISPEDIRKVVDSIKGKWILSYNNIPAVRKAFKGYNIKKVNTNWTMGGDSKLKGWNKKSKQNINSKMIFGNVLTGAGVYQKDELLIKNF